MGMDLDGEWIAHLYSGKTTEVPVGSPQFANTVLDDQRGDMRIMNKVADSMARLEQALHENGMARSLPKHRQRRRLEQRIQVLQSTLELCRWVEYSWVGDYS